MTLFADETDDEQQEEERQQHQQHAGRRQQQQRQSPKKRMSRSERANVIFPVGRMERNLRKLVKERVAAGAPVFLAGVFDSLTAELLEEAGCIAARCEMRRIKPRHIMLAIHVNKEFGKLIGDAVIPWSGRPAGALAPLHRPTSRLRMSKERRDSLAEADSRKRKAGSRRTKQSQYDMDVSPPSSDMEDEEGAELASGYRMRSAETSPSSNVFSSYRRKSAIQAHQKDSSRRKSLRPHDHLASPPSDSDSTVDRGSSDSASRWRRGSSVDRPSHPTKTRREETPDLPTADRSASSSSNDRSSSSDGESGVDNNQGRRIETKKRKHDVYEFRPVARKKPPPPRFMSQLANPNSTSPSRRSPSIDNDRNVPVDLGGTGANADGDDEVLPDLPFFPASRATASKSVQAKTALEKALASTSPPASRNPLPASSPPVLPSSDMDTSDVSVNARYEDDSTAEQGYSDPFDLNMSDYPFGADYTEEAAQNLQSSTFFETDKDSSEDSDTGQGVSTAPTSRESALLGLNSVLDPDKTSSKPSNADLGSSELRKEPGDSLASDKLPQDSIAYYKRQLFPNKAREGPAATRRSSSPEPSQSEEAQRPQDKSPRVRSPSSGAEHPSKSPSAGTSRVQATDRASPDLASASSVQRYTAVKAIPKSANRYSTALDRARSRFSTPGLPDMDLTQTTQASLWPTYHQESFGEPSQSSKLDTQLRQGLRARSSSSRSTSSSLTTKSTESSVGNEDKTTSAGDTGRMDLDDPDTDGTDGDDEKEEADQGDEEGIDVDAVPLERRNAPSPELEEQPSVRRRPFLGIIEPHSTVRSSTRSLPLIPRQTALPSFKLRSQSVRSTTGLETQSQVEKALYDADSIATAVPQEESAMLRSAGTSTQRSSLLASSRSSASSRPTSAPRSTKAPLLPSSSLPRLAPLNVSTDLDIGGSRQSDAAHQRPSSSTMRKTKTTRSRVSVKTLRISPLEIIEISSGEEDGSQAQGNDEIIFVKEERLDDKNSPPRNKRQTQVEASQGTIPQIPKYTDDIGNAESVEL